MHNYLMSLDIALKTIASTAEHLDYAEEAVVEENWTTARIELDEVDIFLEELREIYRQTDSKQQPLLAKLVKPLRSRRDAVENGLPVQSVVSQGQAEQDPEEELEPEE